mmetsp:Transcript_34697/g.55546  ORF Transcript_34697/g.55546 Transcript_34697/m.55546 type:complete len:238 (-) Transcript_34697:3104-3817(-)
MSDSEESSESESESDASSFSFPASVSALPVASCFFFSCSFFFFRRLRRSFSFFRRAFRFSRFLAFRFSFSSAVSVVERNFGGVVDDSALHCLSKSMLILFWTTSRALSSFSESFGALRANLLRTGMFSTPPNADAYSSTSMIRSHLSNSSISLGLCPSSPKIRAPSPKVSPRRSLSVPPYRSPFFFFSSFSCDFSSASACLTAKIAAAVAAAPWESSRLFRRLPPRRAVRPSIDSGR